LQLNQKKAGKEKLINVYAWRPRAISVKPFAKWSTETSLILIYINTQAYIVTAAVNQFNMLNLPDHTLQDEIEMTSRKAAIDVEAGGEAKDDVLVEEEAKTRPVRVPCICFDLAHRSTNYQFVVLSASVFGFYLVSSVLVSFVSAFVAQNYFSYMAL
jgi:hypothetical protein